MSDTRNDDADKQEAAVATSKTKSIFTKLDASEEGLDAGSGITEIESLCMDCYNKVNTFIRLHRKRVLHKDFTFFVDELLFRTIFC